jgi:hypothetical protein
MPPKAANRMAANIIYTRVLMGFNHLDDASGFGLATQFEKNGTVCAWE